MRRAPGRAGAVLSPPPSPLGRAASLQRPSHRLVDAEPLAAGLSVVLQERTQQRLFVFASIDGEMVAQHNGALPFHNDGRVPAYRAQPPAEFIGVVHRGGKADEVNLGRAQHEDLLPDAATVGVLNEVDLVEHHRVQPLEEIGSRQQHVAQHFGRHDHDRRSRAQGGVTGEEADMFLAVGGGELPVLLVRQRLERRRVERLAVGRQGSVDGIRGHQRLARPCGGGHQDRVPGVQRLEGLVLEVVEGERQVGLELRRPGRRRDGPLGGGQRPSSFPMPMERK